MIEEFAIPPEFSEVLFPIRKQQIELSKKVILEDSIEFGQIHTIAGLDIAYSKDGSIACAGVVVIDFRNFDVIEEQIEFFSPPIPYIPSFLFHRESPGYLQVLKKLQEKPDILIFDGNGVLHPFGCGLASQMGLAINKPCFGVAKKLLFGEFNSDLRVGGFSLIKKDDTIIGAAFQSLAPPAQPVYVSVGHLMSLSTVVNIMREFTYFQVYPSKLPTPLTLADKLVREQFSDE
ncbi:MAG: endonuclease V [Candidatus Thorarchaeota archaeon]